MNCPKCETPCDRDEVDVGVGVICGPWRCNGCGWSDDSGVCPENVINLIRVEEERRQGGRGRFTEDFDDQDDCDL